jgi:hypothetical protein
MGFFDVIECNSVDGYRRLRTTYSLHLQGNLCASRSIELTHHGAQ